MPLALKPPAAAATAPSRALLRFLRAQFTGAADCAAVRRCPHASHAVAVALPRQGDVYPCGLSRTTRYLSTSAPRRGNAVVLQAALWDVESLLPRSLRKQRPPTITNSGAGKPRRSSSGQSSDGGGDDCRAKPRWKDWLFGHGTKQGRLLKEEDLRLQLEEESGSIFPRRSLTAKAALDPRLRCTEVDGNGDVIMVDGELKKSELIAKVNMTWLLTSHYIANAP